MARVTGGVGRSQRCCRAELRAGTGTENARDTPSPLPTYGYPRPTPPTPKPLTHIHTPEVLKRKYLDSFSHRAAVKPGSSKRMCVCACVFMETRRRGREEHNASGSWIERRELWSRSSMYCSVYVCAGALFQTHSNKRPTDGERELLQVIILLSGWSRVARCEHSASIICSQRHTMWSVWLNYNNDDRKTKLIK